MDEKLKQVFCDIFRMKPEMVHDRLTPDDIPSWDSFQHLNLVVTIEERFDISLTPDEIEAMRASFGAIKQVLQSKGIAME